VKDQALEVANGESDAGKKLNALREYLQLYILRTLHDQGFFGQNAFIGGTALRVLHGLPRFSEDLDFSTRAPVKESYLPSFKRLKEQLERAGYRVAASSGGEGPVQYAFIKFSDLLQEAGIASQPGQLLAVKLEVDRNPPLGAEFDTRIVSRYFPLALLTHDTPSLFAGKLHALLCRKYSKGRDYFDLCWYLSHFERLAPNLAMLSNALQQTGWKGEMPGASSWKKILRRTVQAADWGRVNKDVENFVERSGDIEIFSKENLLKLLGD